jgi:hypothetical protein
MRNVAAVALTLIALAPVAPAADTKFTSTWKSPEAAGTSFAGRKVAALVISGDENLRVSVEEGLGRELAKRGLVPTMAYRLVPREELRDAERARPWFERAGVEGVVALRLVSADKERRYEPGVWMTPYYSSLWGYYGHGWGTLYDPGTVREDTVIVIEALIFSVPRNMLLWAGVSRSTNPKSAARLLEDLVEAAVKEMQKQGLVDSDKSSRQKR